MWLIYNAALHNCTVVMNIILTFKVTLNDGANDHVIISVMVWCHMLLLLLLLLLLCCSFVNWIKVLNLCSCISFQFTKPTTMYTMVKNGLIIFTEHSTDWRELLATSTSKEWTEDPQVRPTRGDSGWTSRQTLLSLAGLNHWAPGKPLWGRPVPALPSNPWQVRWLY